MSIAELKLEIIAKIIDTVDVEVLNRIQEILNNAASNSLVNEPPATYEKVANENIRLFNEWEQKQIDKALEQYKNGECISDEEADKEIQKWLED